MFNFFRNYSDLKGVNAVLKKANFPIYQVFKGKYITVKPFHELDIDSLYLSTHGSLEREQVWQYLPYGPFENCEDMKSFYKKYLAPKNQLGFCVYDNTIQKPIGMTCLQDINPEMATLEIGSVMYGKEHQKTTANTETMFMLITYCIEKLGYRRITWRCNYENNDSKKAALRLGFEFEGIFHNHMIVKGTNRDTAWFGLTDKRWPMLSKNYQAWLYSSDKNIHRPSLTSMNALVPRISAVIMQDPIVDDNTQLLKSLISKL